MPVPVNPPASPGYLQTSQTVALGMLAERLGDPTNIYWTLAELRLYLAEALRTWNAYTGWYRKSATLTTTAGTPWYDLTQTLQATNPLGYNVKDTTLASVILYHLIENQIAGGVWVGTDQFDLAKVQNALQTRLNRFLGDTGCTVNWLLQLTGLLVGSTRVLIPGTTIDVRRVAWLDPNTQYFTLWRANEFELDSFLTGWLTNNSDPPQVYSLSVTPPVSLVIAPATSVTGSAIELLLVSSGPILDLTGAGILLQIPDDLSWGVKWGALADLLSGDGQSKDVVRADYCEKRYQECVELAKAFPSVLQVQVNGSPVFSGSVFQLDAFLSGWENLANGTPTAVGLDGRNMLALSPAPVNGTVVTMDVISNMAVPANDAAILQIPPDVLPVILDYCQHLASFKMGGDEFLVTAQQHKNMIMEAANYNNRLRELDFYTDAMRAPSLTGLAEIPRIAAPDLQMQPSKG